MPGWNVPAAPGCMPALDTAARTSGCMPGITGLGWLDGLRRSSASRNSSGIRPPTAIARNSTPVNSMPEAPDWPMDTKFQPSVPNSAAQRISPADAALLPSPALPPA
jgi:hypothetical protein